MSHALLPGGRPSRAGRRVAGPRRERRRAATPRGLSPCGASSRAPPQRNRLRGSGREPPPDRRAADIASSTDSRSSIERCPLRLIARVRDETSQRGKAVGHGGPFRVEHLGPLQPLEVAAYRHGIPAADPGPGAVAGRCEASSVTAPTVSPEMARRGNHGHPSPGCAVRAHRRHTPPVTPLPRRTPRLRHLGGRPRHGDTRRPAARPLRWGDPRDVHRDHRHRPRRYRPRDVAWRAPVRPGGAAAAAGTGTGARWRGRGPGRTDGPTPRADGGHGQPADAGPPRAGDRVRPRRPTQRGSPHRRQGGPRRPGSDRERRRPLLGAGDRRRHRRHVPHRVRPGPAVPHPADTDGACGVARGQRTGAVVVACTHPICLSDHPGTPRRCLAGKRPGRPL